MTLGETCDSLKLYFEFCIKCDAHSLAACVTKKHLKKCEREKEMKT